MFTTRQMTVNTLPYYALRAGLFFKRHHFQPKAC